MGEEQPQYLPSLTHSDGTDERYSVATSSADLLNQTTCKMMNEHKAPNFAGKATENEKPSIKRVLEPPRISKNQIYCNHDQCAENPPAFRGPVEWK
jgi:hypothetical protein